MAQATETDDFGFEVIIHSPHVFHYPKEGKFDVEWECLFQLYQKSSLDKFTMKNKTHILLAYNCEYVFSAFNFMLLFC